MSAHVVGMLLAGSAPADSWPDLWYRRDQQGQNALQAGDPTRAAALFADPRRQAYAELESGQYAAAAKRLEPLTDADSQYNRGNALARSGDLQGALNAYDGALKHADLESSLRRDAQHNRDLVARQLQSQKDQPQSSASQQPPDNGKQRSEPQGNESKNGSGDAKSSSPPSQSPPSQSPSSQSPPTSSPPPTTPSSPQPPSKQATGQQANAGRQEPSQGSESRSATGQRDDDKGAIGDSSRVASGESALPQTEQQLALEQWLRQIPDDPGGLLRRKFMIEHLMKQQQVQP